jgi:hypothetical protein
MLKIERALQEKAGFELVGPAEAPFGGCQVFQERFFGWADGLIFGFEGVAEPIELGLVFHGWNQDFSG